MDARISEGLDLSGVNILHVNPSAKYAADDKLRELIDSFIAKFTSNSVLAIITGDINFKESILKARRKQISNFNPWFKL
jgi:hypothetical protein